MVTVALGDMTCWMCKEKILAANPHHQSFWVEGRGFIHERCAEAFMLEKLGCEAGPDIADLLDKLVVVHQKLWAVCEKKDAIGRGEVTDPEEMRKNAADDIALCRERARLKGEINRALGGAGDSVKLYGGGK